MENNSGKENIIETNDQQMEIKYLRGQSLSEGLENNRKG